MATDNGRSAAPRVLLNQYECKPATRVCLLAARGSLCGKLMWHLHQSVRGVT